MKKLLVWILIFGSYQEMRMISTCCKMHCFFFFYFTGSLVAPSSYNRRHKHKTLANLWLSYYNFYNNPAQLYLLFFSTLT